MKVLSMAHMCLLEGPGVWQLKTSQRIFNFCRTKAVQTDAQTTARTRGKQKNLKHRHCSNKNYEYDGKLGLLM